LAVGGTHESSEILAKARIDVAHTFEEGATLAAWLMLATA